jgi:hypothetical protein
MSVYKRTCSVHTILYILHMQYSPGRMRAGSSFSMWLVVMKMTRSSVLATPSRQFSSPLKVSEYSLDCASLCCGSVCQHCTYITCVCMRNSRGERQGERTSHKTSYILTQQHYPQHTGAQRQHPHLPAARCSWEESQQRGRSGGHR